MVAMTTFIFHRLKMGKVKIDNFFLFQWRYLEFVFTDFYLSSPLPLIWLLSESLNLIGARATKGQIFGEKIFFSETIRWMKLILSIHVYDIILYINCVFCCGQVRTLVAMTTFSLFGYTWPIVR